MQQTRAARLRKSCAHSSGSRHIKKWVLFCLCILVAFFLAADPAGGVNSKKGIGYTGGSRDLVAEMGASWVRTWGVDGSAWQGTGVRFFPTIEKAPLVAGFVPESYLETLRAEARRNPGACWIYGNEPDGTDPGSDPWSPRDAMMAWPQVYQAIKGVDPRACFIFGNVIWESYLGYSGNWWLEECMALEPNLRSQIDAWGMHLYAEMVVEAWQWWAACPPEGECVSQQEMYERFTGAVDKAIEWSKDTGGGLPIYFTEWGQLRDLCQGFSCAECKDGLECDYREMLIRRLVPYFDRDPMISGYAWFGTLTTDWIEEESGEIVDGCGSWCPCCESALVDQDGLTTLGEAHAMPYQQLLMSVYSHFGSPLH